MTRKVEVLDYDAAWQTAYAREVETLANVFKDEAAVFHHFGSTSVPGLSAKPIVDILVEVRDIQRVDALNAEMSARGYLVKGEYGIAGRRFFVKGTEEERSHHVHVYQKGNPEIATHLDFRDYLLAHPEAARAYGGLKQNLARQYPTDMDAYIAGKDALVKELTQKAREWKMNQYPTIFSVTEDEIDLNDLLAKITLTTTGAAAIFTGMVRGETSRDHPHVTEYLEYEAYVPMAEEKMQQVADEIRAKWDTIEGIAIIQRIGKLYPKTPTTLIACTAAHRDTGVFDAARYGIDRLKEIVPIWKKEIGPDGAEWVEGDYLPKPGE